MWPEQSRAAVIPHNVAVEELRHCAPQKDAQTKTPSGGSRRAFKLRPMKGVFGLDRSLASDVRDIAAADAEVAKFTVGHTAEFADGLTVLAPVVKRACQVHVIYPFRGLAYWAAARLWRRPDLMDWSIRCAAKKDSAIAVWDPCVLCMSSGNLGEFLAKIRARRHKGK